MQNILEKTEEYAKELPYVEFSRKEISHMGEDLANRSEWVNILITTFYEQFGMDLYEAGACLYEMIADIVDGSTLCQLLEILKEQNEEQWSLEASTELWLVISGLMLEFELPMLKGRSREQYAEEQKCSPWSIGMLETSANDLTAKDCAMCWFPTAIQEWMYNAVNFGAEDCMTQLLDYKEQKHICSEEYLYLLATACIRFGRIQEAEKLIQQLKSGSVSGRRVAKHLKLLLQNRFEVFEDEEEWLEMAGWNPIEEMTVQQPYVRESPKVGRNDPCPCGSGKKYKKCCGK